MPPAANPPNVNKTYTALANPSGFEELELISVPKAGARLNDPETHDSQHASLLSSQADNTTSGTASSDRRDTSGSRTPSSSTSRSRRDPPAALDLTSVNKPFPAKSMAVVDKGGDRFGAGGEGKNKYVELPGTSDSKRSGDTSDFAASIQDALTPTTKGQQPASKPPASVITGILRDATRRLGGGGSEAAPARAETGVRIVEPNSRTPRAKVEYWNDFGSPPEEPSAVSTASTGWIDKEAAIRADAAAAELPEYKPRFWTKKKKIFVGAAVAILCIVIVVVAVVITRPKAAVVLPQTNVQEGEPKSVDECLTLYRKAPSDQPSSYPCNVCQPVLREAGNDFDGGSTKGTGAVLQFCALADILQSSEDTTQRLYNDAGWGKGVNPCKGWKGVECKDGKISRLSLEGAVVPAGLPESLGDLVTLKEFRVVGSRVTIGEGQNQRHEQYPKGPIPKSLSSLKLTTLDLEVTSLSELGNLNFDTLTTLTTLILMNNAALGRSVPFLAKNRDMKSLTISGQELSEMDTIEKGSGSGPIAFSPMNANRTAPTQSEVINSLEFLLPQSLTFLDLSDNGLTGSVPSFSFLNGLTTLYLQDNDFEDMRYLAVTITGINLAGNKRLKTSLQNNVYPDICNAENHSELTYCDFRNTLLRKPGSNVKNSKCGACLFDERSE